MSDLFLRCLPFVLLVAGCSAPPDTFINYANEASRAGSPAARTEAPRMTDALALNYANEIESLFRAHATGARYTREASNTAYAAISAFTTAASALAYSASTATGLGLAGVGIVQLQEIFDARRRSLAYGEAAERIHDAVKDFVAYNLNNVSTTQLTPNGWTLANVVQSNIDMVAKVLAGRLPSAGDLIQANEPMSRTGAYAQSPGEEPRNNITRRESVIGPNPKPALPPRTREESVTAEDLQRLKKEALDQARETAATETRIGPTLDVVASVRGDLQKKTPPGKLDYGRLITAGMPPGSSEVYEFNQSGLYDFLAAHSEDADVQQRVKTAAEQQRPTP